MEKNSQSFGSFIKKKYGFFSMWLPLWIFIILSSLINSAKLFQNNETTLFDYLFDALVKTSGRESAYMKLTELEKVFVKPDGEIETMGSTNPLLPTEEQITQVLKRIRYYKQQVS